jgi:mono/diheme cytochrome c family protein
VVAAATLFTLSLPVWSQDAPEPPPINVQFEEGSEIFRNICSQCHGPHMVNPGNSSFDLRKFPYHNRTRFFNSVRNGKNAMSPHTSGYAEVLPLT